MSYTRFLESTSGEFGRRRARSRAVLIAPQASPTTPLIILLALLAILGDRSSQLRASETSVQPTDEMLIRQLH